MKKIRAKKRQSAILICVMILVLMHLGNAFNLQQHLNIAMINVSTSVREAFSKVTNVFKNIQSVWDEHLYEKLKTLEAENKRLLLEKHLLESLKVENGNLRDALSIDRKKPDFICISKVVEIFISDYSKACVINSGSDHGISIDDIVLNANGLIGIVFHVEKTWSKVLMITDINSNIHVKIGKVNAIAGGNNGKFLKIAMKNDDSEINIGDEVKTLELGNFYKGDIPVGKIIEKNKVLLIKPYVDFNNLNYVAILGRK